MDLECITLSEMSGRERQRYDFNYVWNLKQNKKHKTETDSQIQRTNWWSRKGSGRREGGAEQNR